MLVALFFFGVSLVKCNKTVTRQVLAAALLRPQWQQLSGIELLPDLHNRAAAARAELYTCGSVGRHAAERSCLLQGDMFGSECAALLQQSDIIFCYSTAFPVRWTG